MGDFAADRICGKASDRRNELMKNSWGQPVLGHEHEGKLYVGYSNGGGPRGNHNSAELAVVSMESLRIE